jgi:hypothetical protein
MRSYDLICIILGQIKPSLYPTRIYIYFIRLYLIIYLALFSMCQIGLHAGSHG